jgi:hypothetical protein
MVCAPSVETEAVLAVTVEPMSVLYKRTPLEPDPDPPEDPPFVAELMFRILPDRE